MRVDETTFHELAVQWDGALAAVKSRETRQVKTVVEEWVPRFHDLAARQLELKKAGEWTRGRSDFLGVMWMERAEIRHSRLIAWLLDPLGRHGLGAAVLRGVLKRCFPGEDFEPLEDARPECEVVRGPHRADIVVWLSGRTVVIENKVDAPEAPGQCDGMCREFADDPDPHFVYLTPRGRPPENSSGAGRELFQPLAYGELRDIIQSALEANDEREADGRHIAVDYLRTLEMEFP